MNIDPPPGVIPLVKDNSTADSIWKQWFNNLYRNISDTGIQELTASGAVKSGIKSLELSHASVVIASTIADASDHAGVFSVKNTSSGGTAAHTCTLTSGTWDGTNTVATLNAPGESLVVYFDSAGDGIILANIGSVTLT